MVKVQAKARLLEAAVGHALNEGIVDLSLREIASAIGTSHRMLIYHFGSREGLLVAVVREVERREREMIAWESFTADDRAPRMGAAHRSRASCPGAAFFRDLRTCAPRAPGNRRVPDRSARRLDLTDGRIARQVGSGT